MCVSVHTFKYEYLFNKWADCNQILAEAILERGKGTDSFQMVIMGENLVTTLALSFLIGTSLVLQVRRTTITFRKSSKFFHIRQRTAEIAFLERLEKSPFIYNGENVVTILSPFIFESSSFLQVKRTCT